MRKFQAGKWIVEPETGQLCRPEIEPVPLEPGVMGVLVALLEEPGRLWSRSDLVDTVWQGHRVGDGVVHRAVAVLCRILGSSGQPTIETVPDRGYRWVGPVEVLDDGSNLQISNTTDPTSEPDDDLEPHDVLPVESQNPRRRSSSGVWATWAIAVGLVVGLGAWVSGSSSPLGPALHDHASAARFEEGSTLAIEETRPRPNEFFRVDGLHVDLRRLLESMPPAATHGIQAGRRVPSEGDRVDTETFGQAPIETRASKL